MFLLGRARSKRRSIHLAEPQSIKRVAFRGLTAGKGETSMMSADLGHTIVELNNRRDMRSSELQILRLNQAGALTYSMSTGVIASIWPLG